MKFTGLVVSCTVDCGTFIDSFYCLLSFHMWLTGSSQDNEMKYEIFFLYVPIDHPASTVDTIV